MAELVLLRHGESAWNAADVFTGWIDVRLSDHGKQQAHEAGRLLATRGRLPEVVHTSIIPDLRQYECVLVVSHGNTLRAQIKYLETVSDDAVSEIEVPNATPLCYEFPAGRPGRPG